MCDLCVLGWVEVAEEDGWHMAHCPNGCDPTQAFKADDVDASQEDDGYEHQH